MLSELVVSILCYNDQTECYFFEEHCMFGSLFKSPLLSTSDPIKSYSINLMWLNGTKKEETYVAPEKSEVDLINKLLSPTIQWAVANPEAEVYLWYDSVHTSDTAVINTQRLLTHLMQENHISNVKLRDIREIPVVQKNPDCFSDQIPTYFRIDLLKCIILVDAIERESKESAIFSDLTIGDARPAKGRMSKSELFSPEVMDQLNQFGLILGLKGGRIENQFLQLSNNKKMIEALKVVVINTNLIRIIHALNDQNLKQKLPNHTQSVYQSMKYPLYEYYNAILNDEPILVRSKDELEPYSFEKHGYEPFGLLPPNNSIDLNAPGMSLVFTPFGGDPCRKVDAIRGGNSHTDRELISRPPANDGEKYSCTLMELSESPISFTPTRKA